MDYTFNHKLGRAGDVLVDLDSPAHVSVARATTYGQRLGVAPVLRAAPELRGLLIAAVAEYEARRRRELNEMGDRAPASPEWVLAAERLLKQISDEEKTP